MAEMSKKAGNQEQKSANESVKQKTGLQEEADPFIKLYNDIEWIQNRCKEMRISIDYENLKDEEQPCMRTDDEQESIGCVPPELTKQITAASIANTIIPRSQLADILYRTTIGEFEDTDIFDKELGEIVTEEVQKSLQKMLTANAEISSQIIAESKQVTELDEEVVNLQLGLARMTTERHNLVKKVQRRQEKIKQVNEKSVTERLKRQQDKASRLSQIICINNHILQLLISYSGIHWANDEKLLEILCECGRTLDEQLNAIDD